jgi:hypothetical protein
VALVGEEDPLEHAGTEAGGGIQNVSPAIVFAILTSAAKVVLACFVLVDWVIRSRKDCGMY